MKSYNFSGERRLDSDRLVVFDTTLRDGAQTPKIGIDDWERFIIAKALAYVGVDVIEAGFAANSIDYPIIRKIAKYIGSRESSSLENVPEICSLSRLLPEDVEKAYKSIELADPDKRRLHLFVGTSEELMSHSHGRREKEIIRMIGECVGLARDFVCKEGRVEYSSEDAMRTDFGFLAETVGEAIERGADVINIPDTTGFARPDKYFETIMKLRERVPGTERVLLSAHIHNDSGNAVATTMRGIEAGIRQVEGTVLQLGERAGNVDWMVVVNNLRILEKYYGIDTGHIKTEEFENLGRLVATIIGHPVPLNHPVTGETAFTESSGIHVKGVINNYSTYFVTKPESVGRKGKIELGQTSGINTSAWFLRERGYGEPEKDYSMEQLKDFTERAKRMSIEMGSLTDTEALLLADEIIRGKPGNRRLSLENYQSSDSRNKESEIEVRLVLDGEERTGRGYGVGPVDAFMYAVRDALGVEQGSMELKIWDERAVYKGRGAPGFEIMDRIELSDEEREMLGNGKQSMGQEAAAKSYVEIEYKGSIYHGRAKARNITEATYEAIVDAVDAIFRLNHGGV